MPSTCKITFFSHLYIKSIQYFMFVNFQHNIIYKTTPHHCESSYSCHGNYVKQSLLRHEISTSKTPQARRISTGVRSRHCQNCHFHLFGFPGLNFRRLSFSSWRWPSHHMPASLLKGIVTTFYVRHATLLPPSPLFSTRLQHLLALVFIVDTLQILAIDY